MICSTRLSKNQLVMAHPASSGTAYTALITVLQLKGEDKGWDYWKQFHAQCLAVYQIRRGAHAARRAREAAVSVVFSHDVIAQMEKGLPLVLSFAQEGMGWEIGGMAIVKGAKHPVWPRRGSIGHWSPQCRTLVPNMPPIRRQP